MFNIYTGDCGKLPLRAVVFLGLSAALLLSACHRQAPPSPPPARVLTLAAHSLAAADGGGSLRYPAEVAARYATVMSFRVAGKVIERKARLGDTVHRGEIIARLDPVDAEKQSAAARAALDAAEHRLVFAQRQLDRDTAQAAQNLIAANQLEQTEDAYAAALAGRDQSASQWIVARNTLQYHSLAAEHEGVITGENADTGQVVAAGQAVYGLAWSGDVDVNLDAAASDLSKIRNGQTADVTFPALPNRHFAAHVREVAPAADLQSRTYRVKLTLVDGGPEVQLGMTGDVTLSTPDPTQAAGSSPLGGMALGGGTEPDRTPLFKIPATALFHQGNDPAVWIIRPTDSALELRPVTVRSYSDRWVIVSGGITEGENLVVAGVHTVYAGEQVTPVKPLFADEGAGAVTGAVIAQ